MNDHRLPQGNDYVQNLTVPFRYPVRFTHGLFQVHNPLLQEAVGEPKIGKPHRLAIYVDEGAAKAHPNLTNDIIATLASQPDRFQPVAPPLLVPGGETAKDGWDPVLRLVEEIADAHLDRQSFVMAIGGGAVLDMVGFATAIVHRGLRLLRVPTTSLAQCDAGIGVKNGINARGQKNFIGTFSPPYAVLNDFDFLATLPYEHWIGGVAEAFKVAIIKDGIFFEYLRSQAAALKQRRAQPMEETVRRCAVLHLDHIRREGDPFEFGSSRPLDFGHWSAHKIEILSAYDISHGMAVAVGIALDSFVACQGGLLSSGELEKILGALDACGLPIWHPLLEQRDGHGKLAIVQGLEDFREHLGGRLTVTLPDGIGRRVEVHHLDPEIVAAGVAYLKARRSGSHANPDPATRTTG